METLVPPVNINHLDLGNGTKLAYEKIVPSSDNVQTPTIIYVPGFMSGKDGNKASHMRQFCSDNNLPFVRYDPSCIGDSPGSWETVEFGDWINNAQMVLDKLGTSKNIIIGSSMGGWISLWLASQPRNVEKIQGLMLIAPALNFIRPHYKQTYQKLSAQDQKSLDNGKVVLMDWDEHEKLHVRKSFSENSEQFEINLSEEIPVKCPVRIFHGVQDESVPFKNSLAIMEKISTKDLELHYRKSDDHRFMEDRSLDLLQSSLLELLKIEN